MSDRDAPRPTDAELEILTIVWHRGPSTVREVHENLNKSRGVSYTTVLKFMQIMTDKGLLRRNEEQRAHVYEAINRLVDMSALLFVPSEQPLVSHYLHEFQDSSV